MNCVVGKAICVEDWVEILSDPVAIVVVLCVDTKGATTLVKLYVVD